MNTIKNLSINFNKFNIDKLNYPFVYYNSTIINNNLSKFKTNCYLEKNKFIHYNDPIHSQK